MYIWYFINVPELPYAVADQTRAVILKRYLVYEGEKVTAGTAIAVVETSWAVLQLETIYPCRIGKRLFDGNYLQGISLDVGQPLALAFCNPVHSPKNRVTTRVTILEIKKEKPAEVAIRG